MKNKKAIAVIAVLGVLAFGLGYWSQMPKGSSAQENVKGTEGKKEVKTATANKSLDFLKKGLVAYYPFNGNAKDESGNGNAGIVNGASIIEDRHEKPDQAYFFDGQNDGISLPAALQNDGKTFTISLWLRADSLGAGGGADRRLVNTGNTTFTLLLTTVLTATWYPGPSNGGLVSNEITLGKWHHFVFTVKDLESQTFFNSSLKSEAKLPNPMHINQWLLGSSYKGHGMHFHGAIDDVRIYNRALSEAEVKALFEFEKVKE